MELRDYQQQVIDHANNALKESDSNLIVMPTGSGKTGVAGEISRRIAGRYQDHKSIALYLVHREELLNQTVATLGKFGLDDMVGVIKSGMAPSPWKPLQVATVQTLGRRLDKVHWVDPLLIFIDEAHHARAKTWEQIIAAFPKAKRIGLTATPARLDNKGLGKWFASMTQGPSTADLIADGWLADFEIYSIPPNVDLTTMTTAQQDEAATGPVIASAAHNFERLARDRRTLHFGVSIRHSQAFVEKLRERGYRAEHLDGDTPHRNRDAILERFDRGETQVLSNCALFKEGLDCPECDCVILSKFTKSITDYRQAVGRAMRKKVDGRKSIIIDLCGLFAWHGSPDREVAWTLEDGWIDESRKNNANAITRCEACDFVYPSKQKICPNCGHESTVPVPVEVDIDLEEVALKRKNRSVQKAKREENRRIIATGGDSKKLHALAKELGYSPGVVRKWKPIYKWAWRGMKR